VGSRERKDYARDKLDERLRRPCRHWMVRLASGSGVFADIAAAILCRSGRPPNLSASAAATDIRRFQRGLCSGEDIEGAWLARGDLTSNATLDLQHADAAGAAHRHLRRAKNISQLAEISRPRGG